MLGELRDLLGNSRRRYMECSYSGTGDQIGGNYPTNCHWFGPTDPKAVAYHGFTWNLPWFGTLDPHANDLSLAVSELSAAVFPGGNT